MKFTSWNNKEYEYEGRLYFNNDYEYSHIYMDFYYTSDSGDKSYGCHDLSGFQVSCQLDKDSIQKDTPCYAIRFEFRDSVNVDNYKEVSAILKKIESGLTKYREVYGSIETMGEYLTVVCSIIGIKRIDYNNGMWKSKDIKWIVTNFLNAKKEDWYAKKF